jgi:hypothetical protein
MFKEYLQDQQEQQIIETDIALLVYSMEYTDSMNEELLTEAKVNDYLAKFGLTIHKKGPGLIDYITDFVKGTGKIFIAALKGDKEEVKKISSNITKEHVMDFLLKLDAATLHIITGPVHFIDAVTGWDLWANVEKIAKRAQNTVQDVWKALNTFKDSVIKVFDDHHRKSLLSHIDKIETMIPKPQPVNIKVKV